MVLNTDKCQVMRFHRLHSPIMFQYCLGNNPLFNAVGIKDLGITFQKNLSFECHIDQICSRAMKLLGFVIRNVKDFQDIRSITNVYCSVVRSVLEYGVSIWTPCYNKYIIQLERVQ